MKGFEEVVSVTREHISNGDLFDCIEFAAFRFGEYGREDSEALEVTIRLLEALKSERILSDNAQLVHYLAETAGLFPYLEPSAYSSAIKLMVAESHRIRRDTPFIFHSEQMRVFLLLLQGSNVILSAPTSFGKSAIVDHYIAEKRPSTVVIIVPTIALIDETRRRLINNLGSRYQVLFHKDDKRDRSHAIYVMTQERLLDRSDIDAIDLLFIDEFYKLDPERKDSRYQLLNIALYKFSKISRQVFMAGPHISGINFGQEWRGKFHFFQTDYKTVAVDIIDRTSASDRLVAFIEDYRSNRDQLSIVFTASPSSARDLANNILGSEEKLGSGAALELADWLSDNYSPYWNLVSCLKGGVGLHHGRLPRSVSQKIVDLFESSQINLLICTSTLIEGVNTSAAIIYVYDKKINNSNFDFFSFANIRGRAGRMKRHFIGKVYLYHKAPLEVDTMVDVPIYADPINSGAPILFAINAEDAGWEGMERRNDIVFNSGLSPEIIEKFGSLGLENLISLKKALSECLINNSSDLMWIGMPVKSQRDKMFTLIFNHIILPNRQRIGTRSGPQTSFFVDQLRKTKSISKFLSWIVKTSSFSEDRQVLVDVGFQFLRACDFHIPTAIMACEAVLRHLIKNQEKVDWGFYATSIENYFRPGWVRALDERGVPFPLAEKLMPQVGQDATVDEAAQVVKKILDGSIYSSLSAVEYRLLRNFA